MPGYDCTSGNYRNPPPIKLSGVTPYYLLARLTISRAGGADVVDDKNYLMEQEVKFVWQRE